MKKDYKIETLSTTSKTRVLKGLVNMNNVSATDHNPYMNYSGEYGKEFNHYVKMGVNESDVQESIDKIVEIEFTKANEDFRQAVDDAGGYIYFDASENAIDDLESSQYVTDRHSTIHHEEYVAMVTVGCLILGMLVFLLAMVYIRRVTRRVSTTRDIEADLQKPQKPNTFEPTKIVHEPLPCKIFLIR